MAEKNSNLLSEAHLMLTAIMAGEADTADKSKDRLFKMCEPADKSQAWRLDFRKLMQTILSAKAETGDVDQAQLTTQCEKFLTAKIAAKIYKSDRCYIIGKLLELQGYSKAAARCYQICIETSRTPDRHHLADCAALNCIVCKSLMINKR